ncbi:MAG: ABC transporter ATP-binding protein [Acidisphaera sp.]|nr:ABC transporter ATP-binding protein [Acidisphaera sp.]
MTRPFLSVQGIEKTYGAVVAVQDVTLDIAEGEFITFLGPSGSGKSTTLYAVAGFLEPTKGDILLNGKSLLDVPSNKRNIGMVFQRYTLFPHLSVADNVAFPLRVRRRPKAEVDARVAAMLKLVRLESMADRMPAQMSGGQQQRVALARALAYNPPILLMDEPLSALDKKLREEIQFEIKRIHNETGVTIMYVTHDQEEALRLSDRIALFNAGRIEQIGTGHDLYEKPASRFVAGFIGNSNFFEGTLSGADRSIRLPDGTAIRGVSLDRLAPAKEDVAIMIRPDHFRLHDGSEAAAMLRGTVTDTTYLGEYTQLAVTTSWGAPLSVRLPQHDPAVSVQKGQPITLTCAPSNVRVF